MKPILLLLAFVPCALTILEGKPTVEREFPFMAHLETRAKTRPFWDLSPKSYWCAGSIVSPNVVLTAGHCVHNIPGAPRGAALDITVSVGVGDEDSEVDGYKFQKRTVNRIFLHEGYDVTLGPVAVFNDLAILVLNYPLEFNAYVQPIRIAGPGVAFQSKFSGQSSIFAGFKTSNDYANLNL
jgi:secreted trypsin-like serine protease